MSTLVKVARRYAFAALGCLVFAVIYAQFSHGVYSLFMTWVFLVPLIAGSILALILHLKGVVFIPLHARQFWGLAVASCTVASCLQGIFEIAGTGSAWLWVYLIVGVAFAGAAIASTLRARKQTRSMYRHGSC